MDVGSHTPSKANEQKRGRKKPAKRPLPPSFKSVDGGQHSQSTKQQAEEGNQALRNKRSASPLGVERDAKANKLSSHSSLSLEGFNPSELKNDTKNTAASNEESLAFELRKVLKHTVINASTSTAQALAHHQRALKNLKALTVLADIVDSQFARTAEDNDGEIRCTCGNTDRSYTSAFIQCEDCGVWQHNACVGLSQNEDKLPDTYLCEQCDPEAHSPKYGTGAVPTKYEFYKKALRMRYAEVKALKTELLGEKVSPREIRDAQITALKANVEAKDAALAMTSSNKRALLEELVEQDDIIDTMEERLKSCEHELNKALSEIVELQNMVNTLTDENTALRSTHPDESGVQYDGQYYNPNEQDYDEEGEDEVFGYDDA